GGDRDRTKRPIMAQIAASHSQQVILTSDNPRTESPGAILDEMMVGVSADKKRKVLRIENRREAIRTAVSLAQANDIILVAGKGHETYQEIMGIKHPFDDREEIIKAFAERR
ncbi:MAG: cyanophycin synthetase, partial [Bacteroidota bacterium]